MAKATIPQTPVADARRYVDNARELLTTKANKENGLYQDAKYVKLAGHAAYTGVLLALDSVLPKKAKGRKDVDYYKEQIGKVDRKMTGLFVAAYDTLHLSMSYDGNPLADVATSGLKVANQLIDWVEVRSAKTTN